MGQKRFWTDYPVSKGAPCVWRRVKPVSYDGDKYVILDSGEEIKRGYLHHGRPGGPFVSHNWARRFLKDCSPSPVEAMFPPPTLGDLLFAELARQQAERA